GPADGRPQPGSPDLGTDRVALPPELPHDPRDSGLPASPGIGRLPHLSLVCAMPRHCRFPWLLSLALLLVCGSDLARGQWPQYKLLGVYPAGGQAGETVEVQLTGAEIDGPIALWFDHPGLHAFHLKGAT